ncbi:ParA family protein (plasmid) [Corynebacterium qintianiae]|uniref:ParA family protein n=1 Tax=Corynebacterium qintianiae TaxID=2709392 RepID=A0A7T0PFY7_9CORY|nr:ParA family protein [Corynebacterium qintianiae]QPK84390.1 ParA family protein [Corynebacterium qintianiae]
MRISFVHTKGGVGKTTNSIMLAAAAQRRGIKVEVFDTDPQGSATRWAEVAEANGDPLDFPVEHLNAKQLLSRPTSDGWQIVDTPPGQASEIQAAIDTADLVIVPTHPAPLDIDRVWPTLKTVTHRMAGVLLIGVHERRLLYQDTRDIFEEQGVPTFYNFVPDREDIKNLFGTNPDNLYTFDDICTEILGIGEDD